MGRLRWDAGKQWLTVAGEGRMAGLRVGLARLLFPPS